MPQLKELPVGVSERTMTLNIELNKRQKMTLISVYAPTMTSPDCVKERFYQELDAILSDVLPSNKIVLMGDFNARVGCDYQVWPGVLGRNGVGKSNSNGLLLLN